MSPRIVIRGLTKDILLFITVVLSVILNSERGEIMIRLGIDEITVVLVGIKNSLKMWDWTDYAHHIIGTVELRLRIPEVLGPRENADKLPSGYTIGYKYGTHDFYFSIAYNEEMFSMGVIMRFSASALAYYISHYAKMYNCPDYNVAELLRLADCPVHSFRARLSRIDFYADYINESVDVNTIYNQLMRGNQEVRFASGRINHSRRRGYSENNITSTFYLGSKRKADALLRVYDKRKEQIETSGYHYKEAIHYDSWVRFEAEYKGKYAHQITDTLKRSAIDNTSLADVIISGILDKYSFYYVKSGKPTKFTKALIDLVGNGLYHIESRERIDWSLEGSFQHILHGSGLFSFLYKIEKIYGVDAVEKFWKRLHEYYEVNYFPNERTLEWIENVGEFYEGRDHVVDRLLHFH